MPDFKEILEHCQIEDKWLNKRCTTTHLFALAHDEDFQWQKWSQNLGIPFPDYHELEQNKELDERRKAEKLLEKWRKRFAFKATYRRLVEIFLEGGSVVLAMRVCEFLKGIIYVHAQIA